MAKATIDKSSANIAALEALQEDNARELGLDRPRYLNDRMEQDHRAVIQTGQPMLGFKFFGSTRVNLQAIELMHTIKKGPMFAAMARPVRRRKALLIGCLINLAG